MERPVQRFFISISLVPAILFLLLTTLPDSNLQAQTITGSLTGKVLDTEGNPVSGAKVSLRNPVLNRKKTVLSGKDGYYVFDGILSSANYEVSASFGELKSGIVRVRISAGVESSLNLTIFATGAKDVVVSGKASNQGIKAAIATPQPSVNTSIDNEEIKAVPYIGEFSDRSYQSLLYFNPTATHSRLAGNPAMGGATGVENVYLIDGIYTNDPVTGTFGTNLNSAFLSQISSFIYGVDAGYGNSTGGLFDILTKSGGSEFHGEVFGWTTRSSFVARANSDDFEVTEESKWDAVDYGAALSGPIVGDRLWFFVGVNPYKKDEREVSSDIDRNTVTGERKLFPKNLTNTTKRTGWIGKLNWMIDNRNSLQIETFGDPSSENLHEGPSPNLFPGYSSSLGRKGSVNFALRWFSSISPSVFLEAHIGTTRIKNDFLPGNNKSVALGTPLILNEDWSTPLAVSRGFGEYIKDKRASRQVGARLTWNKETGFGLHEFLFGGESDSFRWQRITGYTGGYLTEVSNYLSGNPLDPTSYLTRIRYARENPSLRVNGKYTAFFAQDRWSPTDSITLTAGLRLERNSIEGDGGKKLSLNSLSPRFGISWDFTGKQRGKLYATAGRYYERVPLFLGESLSTGRGFYKDIRTASGRAHFSYSIDPAIIAEGVKNQSQDEFTLGFQMALADRFTIGARAVYRRLNRLLETTGYLDPASGGINLIVMNPGVQYSPLLDRWRGAIPDFTPFPKPSRCYKAVEFTFDKRFSDNWFFQGNYTISRLEGNTAAGMDRGVTKTPEPNATDEWDIPSVRWIENRYGLLPTDRTHQIKILGGYEFSHGFLIGGSLRFDSGRPKNRLYEWPRKELGYGTLYAEPRGSAGRFPSATTFNLHFEWGTRIGGDDSRLLLFVDVINIFNEQVPFRIEQQYYFDRDFWTDRPKVNPDWGKTTKNTDPRAIGIGIRWSF